MGKYIVSPASTSEETEKPANLFLPLSVQARQNSYQLLFIFQEKKNIASCLIRASYLCLGWSNFSRVCTYLLFIMVLSRNVVGEGEIECLILTDADTICML